MNAMNVISSDSEEDCYDNVTQKLQQLKNKHALNNLLTGANDSIDETQVIEVDSAVTAVSLAKKQDSDVISVIDSPILAPIELDTPPVGVSTRSRSRKRKNLDTLSDTLSVSATEKGGKRVRGKGRGRGRERGNQATIATAPKPRGTGRRKTRAVPNSLSILTYSIGNTDEYPDLSYHQPIFGNKNNTCNTAEPSAVVDLDESLDNEELSVKVFWQHSDVFKFNIRRLQKLTQIFDFFVNKEGVSRDRLLFTYSYKKTNKILSPNDTPESIDYNIAKFIEGGIVNKEFSLNSSNPSVSPQKKGFMLKFQCQNRKRPFELSVGKDEKLQIAMVKCAEHLEIPIAKLIFKFDGETVKGNTAPNELDMDSGDCIDVKIM